MSRVFGCRKTKVSISNFMALFYGGTTSTFKLHIQQNAKDSNIVIYPWQSISLIRKDSSTLDIVLEEQSTPIMAFIHVLYAKIHKLMTDNGKFLTTFIKMKFKMKLGYSCMSNGLSVADHTKKAIKITLEEKK